MKIVLAAALLSLSMPMHAAEFSVEQKAGAIVTWFSMCPKERDATPHDQLEKYLLVTTVVDKRTLTISAQAWAKVIQDGNLELSKFCSAISTTLRAHPDNQRR
jgi:hypothetical protein